MTFNFFDMSISDISKYLRDQFEVKKATLRNSITASSRMLAEYVKGSKLSGSPLGIKTGLLRSSIIASPVSEISRNVLSSSVATDVYYGKRYERGYAGPLKVGAHSRMHDHNWDKKNNPPFTVDVSAYTRNVNFTGKSFLKPSLMDLKEQIANHLADKM